MFIRKFSYRVLPVLMIFMFSEAMAQQKVDLKKAEQNDQSLFSGPYFRGGVGFTRATYHYGSVYTDLNLSPLNFYLEYGKRMSRNFGTYFGMSANVLLKPVSLGLSDQLDQWTQASLHFGGLYYIKGGNSYFAPEVGLGIGMLETTQLSSENTLGIAATIKYGYDRHITGNFFLGLQAFLSYAHGWHQEDIDPSTGNTLSSGALMYGVALSFKFGK